MRPFHTTIICQPSYNLSQKEGGVVAVNLIAEHIISKRFTDIHWLTRIEHPLKISIGFSLKYSAQFVPGFAAINSQIPMNWRNSPNPG